MRLKGNWVIVALLVFLVLIGGYMIYNNKPDNENDKGHVIQQHPPNGGVQASRHLPPQDDMELLEPADEDILDPNLVGYGPGTHSAQGRPGAENFMY